MPKNFSKYLDGELLGPTIAMFMDIKNNTTYSQVCPDCDHNSCISERNRAKSKIKDIDFLDPLISYKINNYGYRSDDFSKENAELNFLYGGCSNTFGVGVPINCLWSNQLNSFLGGDKFMNLGINSGSYKTMVYDIFNYIRKIGKPKGVFLLFPNIERQINFVERKKEKDSVDFFVKVYRGSPDMEKILSVISEKVNLFEFYNTVKMLEDYLYELGIPFVWSTWDNSLNSLILQNNTFNNYTSSDNFEIYNKIESSAKPEKLDNKYWDVARDGSHLGSKYHLYYALIMHEEWKNKYEKNNQ